MEVLSPPPDGDRNRAAPLLIITWFPYGFALMSTFARVFVRLRSKRLGMDDYLMALATVLFTITCGLFTVIMTNGGARHLFYLNSTEVTLILKYAILANPFSIMASAFGKASVAVLMLRILQKSVYWQKWFIYTNLALYMAITVVYIILAFVQCSALWQKTPGTGCREPHVLSDIALLQSLYGTFMDFALALIPSTVLWKLNMHPKHKVGLCCLLSLGVFAGICSAIKTAAFFSRPGTDFTWAQIPISAWAAAEVSLVIICGNIPTLKPIFDRLRKGTPLSPRANIFEQGNLPEASNSSHEVFDLAFHPDEIQVEQEAEIHLPDRNSAHPTGNEKDMVKGALSTLDRTQTQFKELLEAAGFD
ncbi:protein csx2 [Physcia stellaris]|nr:protein csx2 [Physcia stellaris]